MVTPLVAISWMRKSAGKDGTCAAGEGMPLLHNWRAAGFDDGDECCCDHLILRATPSYAKRSRARARAFIASSSRLRGGLPVSSASRSRRAASATSSTARLNAGSLAFDGSLYPLSLRTNCSADARISSSVAGGSKLKSVRMFRHIDCSYAVGPGPCSVLRTLPYSVEAFRSTAAPARAIGHRRDFFFGTA